MHEMTLRWLASFVCATLFCFMTTKMVGAMQQGGYTNRSFLRWFRRGDNLFFNRLCVLSLCLFLSSTLTALCFSFLGLRWALCISVAPFLCFLVAFLTVDLRYALKVPIKRTGRLVRLFLAYWLCTLLVTVLAIFALSTLATHMQNPMLQIVVYTIFSGMPIVLPFLLCTANLVTSVFENARNRRFVQRADAKLKAIKILRVGIVGSFGKTSVKNVLAAILSEKFKVVATPASYNTPIGVAKTVFSKEFDGAEIFIAEMGARKMGDIAELCRLVKPDYGIFTGVCEQHISSFKTLENVFAEKSEIIKSGARVVCANSLKWRVQRTFGETAQVIYAERACLKGVSFAATQTRFEICIGGEWIGVETRLLGFAAVENILLAAVLAAELGMTAQEIARGIEKIQAIPHRLQLIESNGIYILDDGYNANPRGAVEALAALGRFSGRKCVVTPGIVECGVLEEEINATLGEKIAKERLDFVILVGDTLVGIVKKGYLEGGGDERNLAMARSLEEAKEMLSQWLRPGDAVLFLNDLPDVY